MIFQKYIESLIIVLVVVPIISQSQADDNRLSKERQLSSTPPCKWIEWKKTCEEIPLSQIAKNAVKSRTTNNAPSVKCIKVPTNPLPDHKPYFLSVGLVVRRESDFIEEWARHYVGEGVEHFFIIDQESVVDYRIKNKPVITQLGPTATVVEQALPNMTTHIPTPPLASQLDSQKAVQFATNKGIQGHLSIANMPNMKSSYISIVNHARDYTTWIIMIDSDEFLFASSPVQSTATTLRKLDEEQPNVGQVVVPWMVFGSSDHIPMPKCILSSFTMRFPYDFQYNEDDDGGGNVGARKIHKKKNNNNINPEKLDAQLNQVHEINTNDPFASILGNKNKTESSILKDKQHRKQDDEDESFINRIQHQRRRWRLRRRLIVNEINVKSRRKAFGIGLVKSMVKIDALPYKSWDPTVTGSVHAQRPCPGWTTLSADGRPKGLFIPNAMKNGGRPNMKPYEWVMHDWVRIDTALFRLHHYKFRSKDWMLKVKACRGLDLTGSDVQLPDGAELLEHLEKEDSKSYICDSTLASRQAFGPGTIPGIGPGVRGECGSWAYRPIDINYRGSSSSRSGDVVGGSGIQKKDWLNLIGGRSSFSVDSYVDLGPGCGVGAVFSHATNPIVNIPKCEHYQEDSLVVDYSDPSLHGASLEESSEVNDLKNHHQKHQHNVKPHKSMMNHHFP